MGDEINLKTRFLLPAIASFVITFVYFSFLKANQRDLAVFCNVGQGDAAYLRINSVDILVDAGPSKKVLECLGKHMPFYDKKIELAILSHPQKDHFGGYFSVISRYKIDYFIAPAVEGTALSFKNLEDLLEKKEIERIFPTAGYRIKIGKATIIFFWPNKEYIAKLPSENLNDYSLIFKLKTKNSSFLFTGDASPIVLDDLSQWAKINSPQAFRTKVLKVPHHGSANGLTWDFLILANPELALISVDKNNPYGHPHQKTLNYLKASNTKVWRTDLNGEFKIELGRW